MKKILNIVEQCQDVEYYGKLTYDRRRYTFKAGNNVEIMVVPLNHLDDRILHGRSFDIIIMPKTILSNLGEAERKLILPLTNAGCSWILT